MITMAMIIFPPRQSFLRQLLPDLRLRLHNACRNSLLRRYSRLGRCINPVSQDIRQGITEHIRKRLECHVQEHVAQTSQHVLEGLANITTLNRRLQRIFEAIGNVFAKPWAISAYFALTASSSLSRS